MKFNKGLIEGVQLIVPEVYEDDRGKLMEFFRVDELWEADGEGICTPTAMFEKMPKMGYISTTKPGVIRGPHEHREQTDRFVVFEGCWEFYLWDNRQNSGTYARFLDFYCGEYKPMIVVVPPGVVHAYRNVGQMASTMINCPDKLYAGWDKKEEVDEIRHELDEDSPFVVPNSQGRLFDTNG